MRIPFPANVTYDDRDRVVLPPGLAVVWHGNAVEVDDATPARDIDALRAALLAYDQATPTAAETALVEAKGKAAEARARMEANKGKGKSADLDDVHARLLALEMTAELITGVGGAKVYHK